MLQTLLHIKLAAMVAAMGLDTKEWKNPSEGMVAQVQKLADAMTDVGKPGKSDLVQSSVNVALKGIQDLAEHGDKDALFALGLLSQQSKEQGAAEKAAEFYKRAADLGQLQAMNNLGFLIAGSSKEPEKQREGVEYIKKASDAGNNPARRNMAQIYLQGLGGVPRDPAKAEELLLTAANEKDGAAAYALSQFYMGSGGKDKENDKSGWDWLNKSADLGDPNGLDLLGTLYFQGGKIGSIEIAKDEKKAVEKFKTLAENGNPGGERKMASLLESGTAGVTKDFKRALEGYKLAAQGNDGLAQFRLASMYDNGVHPEGKTDEWEVAPDAATALSLYKLAAQNNLAVAAYYAGLFYEQGRSVDRDASKAFTYYMAAAQNGVPLAMQKVGDFYLLGPPPLMKDPVAAGGWYARSAESGVPEGFLGQGIVIENGVGSAATRDKRFYEAADYYLKAADSAAATDQVRMAAYLRLGILYARGVFVNKGEAPKPDFDNAYIFFQQAVDMDPKNQVASNARDEVLKKLDAASRKKDDDRIIEMKKDREGRIAKAKAAADAGASATPVAAPVPEAVDGTPPPKPKKKKAAAAPQ